jgi:hypothetical protein
MLSRVTCATRPGPAASLILASAALAACGHPGAPGSTIANHGGGAPSEIRAIDWQNRTYELGSLGEVAVTAGHAEFALDDNNKITAGGAGVGNGSYRVEPPLYADVNGDGVEDAVIASATATGGTGQFSEITVYTLRDHKLVELAAIAGGDRGDGGIRKLSLDGAIIVVERNVLADGDGLCCASRAQRERWRWHAGELTEDVAARQPFTPAP